MTPIKINRDTLCKLTSESIEIRLRTLEHLSSKLNRSFALNANVEFNPENLCKQLLRWFGFVPIQQSLKVLNLLKSLIESPKYGHRAINKLGSDRIIKELRKIQFFFDIRSEEFKIITNVIEFLQSFPMLIEKSLTDDESKKTGDPEYSYENYETPWSYPSPSDYRSMKFLSDILKNNFATGAEIDNAVYHSQLIIRDYPAEYMLQAPHIFQHLLQIYDECKNNENRKIFVDDVAASLLQFLLTLEKRLKLLRKSKTFNHPYRKNTGQKNSQIRSQLKIEKVLTDLFDASVFILESHASNGNVSLHVWELIYMVLKLVKNKGSMDILCLYKLAAVVNNLYIKFAETEHCIRLRPYQMLLIFLFQDIVQLKVHSTSMESLCIIEPILRDYTMKKFFTTRHQQFEEFVLKDDKSLDESYKLLKLYESSVEISIQLLIKTSNWTCSDIIKNGLIACKVLDMLQSKTLIDVLFSVVIQGIPLYFTNNQMKAEAIDLLLKLLSITLIPLKTYMYEKLAKSFKMHIGSLMTGERYVLACSNTDLLKAHIVGVPLNTEVLMQVVHDCYENSCDQIKSNSCKILELFLQSRTLFGECWYSLLPIVLPLMPLLNCCTHSEKILDLLLKIFHPDLRQLPYVCVLQGNLGFLFHPNADIRSESLTRLIYSLNSLNDSGNYLPNLLEISDTLPNDICIRSTPREYRNIFNDHLPVRCDVVTSLNNLLHLLESQDVEPLVRKTTLMQINILCSNWRITGELCSAGAYYLILQALENSLQKSSEVDYSDSVVPSISILNKVMLYDSSVRCELAKTPNIYVLLLRALMVFHHDIQVRQDATMCLFQLLFSSQLISTENCIEGPLILGNIILPLDINLRSALYNKNQQNAEKLSRIFNTALEETQYWRMVVASSYFDGIQNITLKSITNLTQLDIREDLKLTIQDVRFIRATQPSISLHRLIKAALNATDHKSLIQACKLIKQQLIMATLSNTFSVSHELCLEMNTIFRRYLKMPPGCDKDLDLYEHVLDIVKICFKIPLELVVLEIFKVLHKDPHHALVTMLSGSAEVPLRIFNKITIVLGFLIDEHEHMLINHFNASQCSSYYSSLFDLFIERCMQLFEIRDLQRVRCLLSLIVIISSCQLDISDRLLFTYCRRFAQLSLALKSFTQTGAQLHRDCLLAMLKLSDQMQDTKENFQLTAGFVKYLSGLCGHSDVEVRTLAWSILNVTAKTNIIHSLQAERKSSKISGTELLINELSYLPGGFIACCLSTFLDAEEVICVRHLAGQLLAVLIQTQGQVEEIEKLFEQYYFTRVATETLTSSLCVLEMEIPIELDVSVTNITTFDVISCYSLIFIVLSQRSPVFLKKLCKRSFMFKIYEILKQTPPSSKHIGYLNMIGHICRLYTLCYSDNFDFLQGTICRDAVWLENFCEILFRIAVPSDEVYITCNMLQIFLILCQDITALEQLSIILQDYSANIIQLLQNALNVKNLETNLQSCCLSVLSLLLIKSQAEFCAEISVNILNLFESDNKEITNHNKKDEKQNFGKEKISVGEVDTGQTSISEHLCISLIRLFTHLYPASVCKFSTTPNVNQQHVTETLALLLKQSPVAQETSQNLKFQDKIIKIFKIFFDEFVTLSCRTYVKRHGENKKMAVIKNLQLLLKLLLSWHSSPSMIITDNVLAMEYSKIIIQIWPWLSFSSHLKLTVLQVCSFLSERSLVVCKQFSTLNNIPFAHSVLHLVAKMIIAETIKIKSNGIDCSVTISFGLRVLMNCCSCLDGRTALNKLHVMNVFDSLYPFNPKSSQIQQEIVIAWLEFLELFSRYEQGAHSHHLNALCSVVNKTSPGSLKRLISLRILRNMSFLNSNRSLLITSTDFIYTVNEIMSQPIKYSVEEQFIVCVALWKLISGGIKFVGILRGSKLAKNLRLLKENLTCAKDENDDTVKFSTDLLNVLNIIFKIFNT